LGEVTGVGEDLESGRVELMYKLLGFVKPAEAMSSCGIVVHISGVNAYTRYFVHMVIPGVHCDTKK